MRIMADRVLIGNCVVYALCAGSAVVWAVVIARKARGRPPLEPIAAQPISWPAAPVCATFLVAFVLPDFIMQFVAWRFELPAGLSLIKVQWRCASLAAQAAAIVGLMAIAGPLKKDEFGVQFERWRGDLLVAVAGWLASFLPVFVARTWQGLLELHNPEGQHVMLQLLESSSSGMILAWAILSTVVAAPLVEELLYRVFLQGWIQSQVAGWKAIVISSFVFVVQHSPYDWVALMPLALILGYVYNRRRSYLAVVVLHAVFNGVMIALSLLAKKS
ncbi:MAG: CPBP family intramembrane metalloprotease [Planctomycetia bacterium]|nr:CPBP family intramembrane metalloprotease [Planctomycetia bacterium]